MLCINSSLLVSSLEKFEVGVRMPLNLLEELVIGNKPQTL